MDTRMYDSETVMQLESIKSLSHMIVWCSAAFDFGNWSDVLKVETNLMFVSLRSNTNFSCKFPVIQHEELPLTEQSQSN